MKIQSKITVKPLTHYEIESQLFLIDATYEGSKFASCWIRNKGSEITHSIHFSDHMQLMDFISALDALEEELAKE